MRLRWLGSSAASGALYGALTPIFALLLLPPASYGYFSIVYLIFAFGVSVQYSVVSEAWARSHRSEPKTTTWTDYSTALSALSGLFALASLIVAATVPALHDWSWALAAAVLFAVYRNGARYYTVANGRVRRALVSDVTGVLAFVVVLLVTLAAPALVRIEVSWLASGVVGSLVLRPPRLRWGSGLISWLRAHGSAVRPLLLDSLLMDAGAIGTPFLLVGFLGATKFGIYRAVSNVALPVRLLLEPLRPTLGRMRPAQLFGRKITVLIAGTTLFLSACCYIVLVAIVPLLGFQVGTLSALVPYALSSSIYVAGSLLGTTYYISCRTNSGQREIMLGRVLQTVVVIVFPIVGFVLGDLAGAIWGYAISSVIAAAAWISLARRHVRPSPEADQPASS